MSWRFSFSAGRLAVLVAIGVAALLVTAIAVVPMAMVGGPGVTRMVTNADGQQMQITVDPATGQQMALPAPVNEGLEQKIDIARIEGQVKASSVKRVAEFVDKHPDESVAITRGWLHESA